MEVDNTELEGGGGLGERGDRNDLVRIELLAVKRLLILEVTARNPRQYWRK